MSQSLKNKRIAILVDHGFEQSELTQPMQALKEAGAEIEIVSPAGDTVKSWKDGDWSDEFKVDVHLYDARAENYDALLLPGGVINPDRLRRNVQAVDFVRGFFQEGQEKTVAAICHGPWTLINAGVVKDRTLTSYESIRSDLENAGAHWVDREVVVDRGLITSRSPDDLDVFCKTVIDEFALAETSHRPRQDSSDQVVYF